MATIPRTSPASREKDVKELLKITATILAVLKQGYQNSLNIKGDVPKLEHEIKTYLEQHRSILDYVAHDICDAFGLQPRIVYFPITKVDSTPEVYKQTVSRNLTGLDVASDAIYKLLESYQPYNEGYEWFASFASLVNTFKHSFLVPQIRTEQERVVVQSQTGGHISWNPAAVTFGNGANIQMFGVPIDTRTQMPVSSDTITTTRETWVDFQFVGTSISAIAFLEMLQIQIYRIVHEIYAALEAEKAKTSA